MRILTVSCLSASVLANAASMDGIRALADRFLDGKGDAFEFTLSETNGNWSRWNAPTNDNYTVAAAKNGKIPTYPGHHLGTHPRKINMQSGCATMQTTCFMLTISGSSSAARSCPAIYRRHPRPLPAPALFLDATI